MEDFVRRRRKFSKSGLYHTVIRGVNKQNIFYENEDKKYFIHLLKKYAKKYSIRVHVFCLMDNHVHLVLEDLKSKISSFIQVVASVYARYFNKKYDRIGHLYQDRFASEVIESEEYYLTVCRYVLQNPLNAGLSNEIDYQWSSYKHYSYKKSFVYVDLMKKLMGSEVNFYRYVQSKANDVCLDMSLRPSEKEEYKIELIKQILKTKNPIIQPDLPLTLIFSKVRALRQAGLSINAISRITGINRYLVIRSRI